MEETFTPIQCQRYVTVVVTDEYGSMNKWFQGENSDTREIALESPKETNTVHVQ